MFGIRLFKSIKANVILQLVVIGGLIVVNFLVVNWFDGKLSEIEKTINLASSNRTFSQEITLYARLIVEGKEQHRKTLKNLVEQHHNQLIVLEKGGDINIAGDIIYQDPLPPSLNNNYLLPLKMEWSKFKAQADILLSSQLYIKDRQINPEVKAAVEYLIEHTDDIGEKNESLVNAYLNYFDEQQEWRDLVFRIVFFINILVIFAMYTYISNNVVKPVSKLNEIENIISEGNFERRIDYNQDDELGRVGRSINTLFLNLRNASDFISSIGEGKLDVEYQRPSETDASKDRLGSALLEMRDKMIEVAETDRQRSWVSKGLAEFADIFRTKSNDEDFTYIIISSLVRYIEANQGGLFIVEDEKDEESHLEMVAAYAFEKRKYMEKHIEKGEGLIGEVYQDGNTMYVTEVPENYINITSGLGDETPRALLLVPLKLNEVIYGVVELASFKNFEPYQIEFVEKLGESIASTFAAVKNSRKTEKLLKDSMQLGEQMKAQEEEMRQNLEELVATQEEVERKNKLIEQQKADLEHKLEEERKKNEALEEQRKSLQQSLHSLRNEKAEIEHRYEAIRKKQAAKKESNTSETENKAN